MKMEILKGYCARVRGQQKWQDTGLQDELFALFKLAWLENARLLARKKGQNYLFSGILPQRGGSGSLHGELLLR